LTRPGGFDTVRHFNEPAADRAFMDGGFVRETSSKGAGMSLGMMIGIAAAAAVVVVAAAYNSLVVKRNQVRNVFATVDALLKKRYDLIPNLVAAVKGYMQHERGTLERLTELRAQAMNKSLPPDEAVRLNNQMSGLLGGLRVAFENYPDLKANQNFLQLQASLNEQEEQISAGRRAYNAAVTAYNNAVQSFPLNLIAAMFGFRTAELFAAAEAERSVPRVDFQA
jgi:LemA protein